MPEINLTMNALDPDGDPVANGAIGIAPAEQTITGAGKMIAAEKLYALGDPFTVLSLEADTLFRFREYKPKGETFFARTPAVDGLYSALEKVAGPGGGGGPGGGDGLDAEAVRDVIAAALVAAGLITVTPNDPGNTITIGTTATQNQTDAFLLDLANATGQIPSTKVSDFTEAAQDAIAALLAGASGVTLNYNDAANTLTITGGPGGGLDAEAVRDAIGVALVGAGNVSVVVNDALDTITITTSAYSAAQTDTLLAGKSDTGHTHTAAQISDSTTAGRALLTASTASAQRTAMGAASDSGQTFGSARMTVPDMIITNKLAFTEVIRTSSRTFLGTDEPFWAFDCTSGPLTATLPNSTANKMWLIKKVDASANALTITTSGGGATIDGQTSIALTSQHDYVILVGGATSGTYRVFSKSGGGITQTALDAAVATVGIVALAGTTKTLALTDAGKLIQAQSTSATTITVPTNATVAFPIGTAIQVNQYGNASAGGTTIAPAGGVTLRTPTGSALTARAQYSTVTLHKIGTDEWLVGGDLT